MQISKQACYKLVSKIKPGRVSTYKELALALGTKAYRAIGAILNQNPNAPKVPCHRVVMSDGSLGGYRYGAAKKASLLKAEGVKISMGKVQRFESVLQKLSSSCR